MHRLTASRIVLSVWFLLSIQVTRRALAGLADTNDLTITLVQTELTEKTLAIRYEIRNEASQDVWLCDSMDRGESWGFEAFLLMENGGTLMVRRRLDLPMETHRNQPQGRYVRLRAGQTRTEEMSLPIPVRPRYVLSSRDRLNTVQHASRLVLEIGYFEGDFPGRILDIIAPTEFPLDDPNEGELRQVAASIGMPLGFSGLQEGLPARDEVVDIGYTFQTLRGEGVLRLTIDPLHIPYLQRDATPAPPSLPPCTHLELECRPSALDFFFPYPIQQNLLSESERRVLESVHKITVDRQETIKALAADLSAGVDDGFLTMGVSAHLTAYRDQQAVQSLTLDAHGSIVDEAGQVFGYPIERFRYLPTLRTLRPDLQAFSRREACASNLADLWHRLCLFRLGERARPRAWPVETRKVYPGASEWCDAIVDQHAGFSQTWIMRPFVCPSAGEGRCHYGMNPACQPNSPGDTVLLFETRAGWNQHGGPELFAFDNHDPRGGCILFNDGTVKFVRTEEELQQLRWRP